MASPLETHVPPPAPTAQDLVYRPVSPLAIAGLAIAVVYTVVVLGAAAAAFISGTPLMLDGWTFAFPVIGAALSAAGWWQVRRSEGTRVGLGLARWGLRLCVLVGLGYWAYSFANELALRMDAERFTAQWFDQLRQGDLNSAFLMTLEPEKREGIRPTDAEDMSRFKIAAAQSMGTPLQMFENQRIVRLIRQGGASTTIEGLGVRDWNYERGNYLVQHAYRVRTREGEFDFLLVLRSTPAKGGRRGARQWYIMRMDQLGIGKPSELGTTAGAWGKQATDFGTRWLGRLNYREMVTAYWDTVTPAERQRRLPDVQKRLGWAGARIIGASAGGVLEGSTVFMASDIEQDLPADYRRFREGLFAEDSTLNAGDEAAKKASAERMQLVRDLFRNPQKYFTGARPPMDLPLWEESPDGVRFTQRLTMIVGDLTAAEPRGIMCELMLTVASDPGPLTTGRRPEWHILRMEITGGNVETKPQAGAPPPDMAPPGGTPFRRS
jgi:hypothetical protein